MLSARGTGQEGETELEQRDLEQLLLRYEAGVNLLRETLAGVSRDLLDFKPAPGKWTIRELTAHITDTEIVAVHRMRTVAAEREGLLTVFDQDAWINELFGAQMPVELALSCLAALRSYHAFALRRLDASAFSFTGSHEVSGSVSLQKMIQGFTDHLEHHAAQIAAIIQQFDAMSQGSDRAE